MTIIIIHFVWFMQILLEYNEYDFKLIIAIENIVNYTCELSHIKLLKEIRLVYKFSHELLPLTTN